MQSLVKVADVHEDDTLFDSSRCLSRLRFRPTPSRTWSAVSGCALNVSIVGGGTSFACGLPQPGVGSDELWTLSITRSDASTAVRGLPFSWAAAAVHLPLSARCHSLAFGVASPDPNQRDLPTGDPVTYRTSGVMGGQLSYTDPSC